MSDDKVSVEFIGEQMLRMQADLRGVRSEQGRLESDFGRLDAKVDRHDASNQARFEQLQRTMTSNLEIMLKAFERVSAADARTRPAFLR